MIEIDGWPRARPLSQGTVTDPCPWSCHRFRRCSTPTGSPRRLQLLAPSLSAGNLKLLLPPIAVASDTPANTSPQFSNSYQLYVCMWTCVLIFGYYVFHVNTNSLAQFCPPKNQCIVRVGGRIEFFLTVGKPPQ